ncbi:MAG: restriction endonuclease [archaeon YNP-LCB-024-027]|jgi:HJR/Mrr/RecB family endonuclease|nr:restriction endonuclease [Candidatus Culexarchaeum yellowstonense]
MPSSYVKGRKFEYTVRAKFAKHGYLSIRASSSKGTPKGQQPLDIVAVKDGKIIMVECKMQREKITLQLLREMKELGEKYGVNTVIVHSNSRITCIVVHDKDGIINELKNVFEEVKVAKIFNEEYEFIEVT